MESRSNLPSRTHTQRRLAWFASGACATALVAALGAGAQTTNGSIAGTVTDSTGAVVAGATVSITNEVTKQVRTATTAGDGAYLVPQLPPGTYDVRVTSTGFATETQTGLVLQVNQGSQANFRLGAANVTTDVTVSAAPPLLDTTNGHVSTVIDQQSIVDLPINGRSFTNLILLTPGASPRSSDQLSAYTVQVGGGAISPSVNGQRSQQNNFTLDGALNNSLFINSFAVSPPPDALKEFAVTSHITDAQFAISSGANVNVVTKSGTNSYHGAAWEFIRNNALDALQDTPNLDQFSQVSSQPYRLNQYGVQFDGPFPLLKDKLWFSGYWEGVRQVQTTTGITNVPNAAERTGDFSDLLGAPLYLDSNGNETQTNTATPALDANGRQVYANEIFNPFTQTFGSDGRARRVPLGGYDATGKPTNTFGSYPINKASAAILAKYLPNLPNIPGVDSLSGNYRYPNLNNVSSDQVGIRIDYRFPNNDLLFGRYNRSNANRVTSDGIDTLQATLQNYAQQGVVGYTHLFGAKTLLDLRYSYAKTNVIEGDTPAGTALINAVNWQDVQPVKNGTPLGPQTYLRGGPFLTQQSLPLGPQTTNQGNVDVSMTRGKHTIGFGGFLYNLHSFADGWHLGSYFFGTSTSADGGWGPSGNGYAGFLLGSTDRLEGSVGDTSADVTTLWKAVYAQDQWKATNKLTLTYGIRWDYVPPPAYTAVTTTLDPFTGQFLISRPEPAFGYPTRIGPENTFYPQYNGYEPRFGFAYTPHEGMVIRGAVAKLDDHNNTLVQQGQDIRQSFPRAASYFYENVWADTSRTLQPQTHTTDPAHTDFIFGVNEPTAASFLTSGTPTIGFAVDPHAKIANSVEYNIGIEQQLDRQTSLTVDYVGSVSRHLFVQGLFNGVRVPGDKSTIPFPQFGQYQQDLNAGTANYNALQAKVTRAQAHGLSFLASYTWSKTLDEQSEGQSGNLSNIYNLRMDYGPADFDYRHLFALSGVYQLPFGKGREYYANVNKATDLLIGGWNFGSIFQARSGSVGQLNCGGSALGVSAGRCLVNPGVPQYIHTGARGAYLNRNYYSTPSGNQLETEGRNDWVNPPTWNEDVSLFKDFHIVERLTFQFRSEFFNVFNTPNVGIGSLDLNSSNFGRLQSAGSPRRIQFAGKIIF